MAKIPINPRLPPEQELEIGVFAEWLADDRFPHGKRIEPIEAESVGIGVIQGHYGDQFDGMLEHDGGRFYIYCNLDRAVSLTSPRARFTLAHELGHYFIPEHRNALKSGRAPTHPSHCDHESKNPVEMEADHFASCLLLPSQRFHKQVKKVEEGLKGICQLAGIFGTSLTSTAIRYAKLDLSQCVVIKWGNEQYNWKWLSPSAYAGKWRKTIEEPAKLLQGSATEQVMSGSASGNEVVTRGSTASCWFPYVWSDTILKEEAVSLGQFGTLTLLRTADTKNKK